MDFDSTSGADVPVFDPDDETMTERYGPPEERARKNGEAVDELVRALTEPGLRGLLKALSRLERPLCAHWLSEYDLDSTPLGEMINPYDFNGRTLTVEPAEPPFYTVSIAMGHGTAGDGAVLRVERNGDTFTVLEGGTICIF